MMRVCSRVRRDSIGALPVRIVVGLEPLGRRVPGRAVETVVALVVRAPGAQPALLVVPGVVAGELAQQLVPDVEALGHVPDGLGHGQHLVVGFEVGQQAPRGAQSEHAVVVVDSWNSPAGFTITWDGTVRNGAAASTACCTRRGIACPSLSSSTNAAGRARVVGRDEPLLEVAHLARSELHTAPSSPADVLNGTSRRLVSPLASAHPLLEDRRRRGAYRPGRSEIARVHRHYGPAYPTPPSGAQPAGDGAHSL